VSLKRNKRSLYLLLLFIFILQLCGCNGYTDVEDLLVAPKSQKIEEKEFVDKLFFLPEGAKIIKDADESFKSIVEIDYNNDKNTDYIVLYRMKDNRYNYFISIFTNSNGIIEKTHTITGYGKKIKNFIVEDLNNDNIPEILIGSSAGAYIKNGLSVYYYNNNNYDEIFTDAYSELIIDDLDGDLLKEVFLMNFYDNKSSKAEIYRFNKEKFSFIDDATFEMDTKRILDIKVGLAAPYKKGIFVDLQVGTDASYTDLFILENDYLVNVFYEYEKKMTTKTFRPTIWVSKDIDNDGIVEIPLILNQSKIDEIYNILWVRWNELIDIEDWKFEVQCIKLNMVLDVPKEDGEILDFKMNYEDSKSGINIIYSNPYTGKQIVISKILMLTKSQWEKIKSIDISEEYVFLYETPMHVYVLNVNNELNNYKLSKYQNHIFIKKHMHIIKGGL